MSLSNKITQNIANYDSSGSVGSRLRAKRITPLIAMIRKIHQKCGEVQIIDIGGTRSYWNILPRNILEDHNTTITIINLPGSDLPPNEAHFKFAYGDGCHLDQFADYFFHIAHANSVIEHVGDWPHMVRFAQEIQRLAPNLFVQTPYFWFPVEPHFMTPFFHWLPRPLRISLIMRFALGNHTRSASVDAAAAKLERYRLLDQNMLQALFPKARIQREKVAGLTKSLIAIQKQV
jgi:hypothetical protein